MKGWMAVGMSAALALTVGCSSKKDVNTEPVAETGTVNTTETETVVTQPVTPQVSPAREVTHPVTVARHHHRRHHRKHKRVAHTGKHGRSIALYDTRHQDKVIVAGANRSGRAVVHSGEHVRVIHYGKTTTTAATSPVRERVVTRTVTVTEFPSLVARDDESKAQYLRRAGAALDELEARANEIGLHTSGDANRVENFKSAISTSRKDLKRLSWSTGTGWRKYTPSLNTQVMAARDQVGRAVAR